jgi:hypothetical protein
VGVLGAAPYVIDRGIERASLSRSMEEVRAEAAGFLNAATLLEPTEDEISLAAEMEAIAQGIGVPLDSGESQLAAMTINRTIAALETGDKRAVGAFEQLLDRLDGLALLTGKVHCLEQLILRLVSEGDIDQVGKAICGEPDVDMTMSICFGCRSNLPPNRKNVLQGLTSYIGHARRRAPRMLAS